MIALIESRPTPTPRVHGRCCGRLRYGRFCCDCGNPLVAAKDYLRSRPSELKVRVSMELADEEMDFDSIKEASDWSGLSRRQIETALDGPRRGDGSKWTRLGRGAA